MGLFDCCGTNDVADKGSKTAIKHTTRDLECSSFTFHRSNPPHTLIYDNYALSIHDGVTATFTQNNSDVSVSFCLGNNAKILILGPKVNARVVYEKDGAIIETTDRGEIEVYTGHYSAFYSNSVMFDHTGFYDPKESNLAHNPTLLFEVRDGNNDLHVTTTGLLGNSTYCFHPDCFHPD